MSLDRTEKRRREANNKREKARDCEPNFPFSFLFLVSQLPFVPVFSLLSFCEEEEEEGERLVLHSILYLPSEGRRERERGKEGKEEETGS